MGRTRVKICCVGSPEEAALAVEAGADAIGLVGAMPCGPGQLSDAWIREIVAVIPPGGDTFLLSRRSDPATLVAHVLECGTSVVQLVDAVDDGVDAAQRRAAPYVRIVQRFHVEGEAGVREAER